MLSKLSYYPLEEVKGSIVIDACHTQKAHEVKLRFIGQERTLSSKADNSDTVRTLFASGMKREESQSLNQTRERRHS